MKENVQMDMAIVTTKFEKVGEKMDKDLQGKIDLFIETFAMLKKQYKWSIGDLTLRFISLIYVLADKPFNKKEFDDMVTYIKKNSKWYSYYRGHQMYSTAALLITKFSDPQRAFINLLDYEEKMKDGGFKKSSYLSIASYGMLLTAKSQEVEGRVKRSMEIYKEMKKNHYWLTSSDDYPIAVLLSGSEQNNKVLISEIEDNYDKLHQEGFSRSNGLQFLSHLLSFVNGPSQVKSRQTKLIYDRLKEEKFHVTSTYYGILGYLTLLGEQCNQATEEVINVVKYLKSHKNFKWIYKDMNVLTATALVSNKYIEKMQQNKELLETGIGVSIEAMVAAQTAALIASTSAVAVATSSSS